MSSSGDAAASDPSTVSVAPPPPPRPPAATQAAVGPAGTVASSAPRPDLAAAIRTGAAQALSGRRGSSLSANAHAKLRSLQWRNQHRLAAAYPYTFSCPPLENVTLHIAQQRQGEQRGIGTGAVVWDGAVMLMKYLERRHDGQDALRTCEEGRGPFLAGKSVVELGAGTGAVGLIAGALGAKDVAITDLEEILFLTRQNVDDAAKQLGPRIVPGQSAEEAVATFAGRIRTFNYRWGTDSEQLRAGAPYDVVLVAECIVPRL